MFCSSAISPHTRNNPLNFTYLSIVQAFFMRYNKPFTGKMVKIKLKSVAK